MDIVIHGHFYQPPRENPWSGRVPRQTSAAPAHDWNERITDECYKPNARSRILGEEYRIEEIVNNYAFINFDFGPTLLTWLEQHAPQVYAQIIEGDRLSTKLQDGHGNAIAQVYNHVIMPLANFRDKCTQITWGLRDFEWRFGRKSESIWLAETAINLETTKLLIEHGLRYVILSPYQALRVRPIDRSRGWSDARGGKVDPRRPYRFFLKDSRRHRIRNRYIDVFFYDGPLAADISFAHLLRDASRLTDRLQQAAGRMDPAEAFVNVATDGEIYGHHEPFADMCLSYAIRREASRRGMRFTNYGKFLDAHLPQHEVDLNFGDQDEGTAWSCAHGVGRWVRDCGCSTGGGADWDQRWRTPLRRGFDMVRDRLSEAFLEQASPLVKDPWALRDDYILAVLDPRPSTRAALLEQHARRRLEPDERRTIWRLLESQRYAMFMYTSCAWFFADISGIETVQNMAYARRAIELAKDYMRLDLETMLLEYLSEARSNIPAMGHGADVYRAYVVPQRIRRRAVAGGLALGAAVQDREPAATQFRYAARSIWTRRTDADAETGPSCHGLIGLIHRDTEDACTYEVHVYGAGSEAVRCYVLPDESAVPAGQVQGFPRTPPEDDVAAAPQAQRFTLRDLVAEDRQRIVQTAYESILAQENQLLADIFGRGRELMITCREVGIPVPAFLKAIAGQVLSCRLREQAARLETSFLERIGGVAPVDREADPHASLLVEIGELLAFAREHEVEVVLDSLAAAFERVVTMLLEKLLAEPNARWARQCAEVIESSYQFHFPLDRRPLEDLAFQVLGKHRATLRGLAGNREAGGEQAQRAFQDLAATVNLSIQWIIEQGDESDPDPDAH